MPAIAFEDDRGMLAERDPGIARELGFQQHAARFDLDEHGIPQIGFAHYPALDRLGLARTPTNRFLRLMAISPVSVKVWESLPPGSRGGM